MRRDDFTWRVTVDPERFVRLFFYQQFSIERDPESGACISALLIYDGYDENAPLIGEYCGESRPVRPRFIFATGNVVFIRFNSRYTSEGSFFRMRWDAVISPGNPLIPVTPPSNGNSSGVQCGGEFFVTESNWTMVTSPGFPNNYDNNLNCIWTLTSDPHFRIALTLITVDMEAGNCQFDRIEVNDGGADSMSRSLGRFCRRDHEGQIVTSSGNSIRIAFKTDASVTKSGFQINARAVCGGVIRGESRGIIKSPNYPANYPASSACEWDVSVRPGRTINVRFDSMQIASEPPACTQDYLMLRNGDSVDSPVMGSGRICGNAIPTAALATLGNRLHVKFVSDGQSSGTGFQLRFQEIGTSCGGSVSLTTTDPEATIESPNRPSTSPANAECEWIILAPSGHSVQLDFTGPMDVNGQFGCRSAAVEVRDGGTLSAPLIGRYCGSNPPGSLFSTRGNSLHIRYFNSVQNPGIGFQARASIGNLFHLTNH